MTRAVLLAILCCVLSACSTMLPGYEQPTVTVSSFRALPSDGVVPDFEIGLHVINPNREALRLEGVSYTVSLGGHQLIKGVGNQLPVIEGYGEGDLTLTASANLLGGVRLVSELINNPADELPYVFEAKLDSGIFRRAIRVREAGEVSLQGTRAN